MAGNLARGGPPADGLDSQLAPNSPEEIDPILDGTCDLHTASSCSSIESSEVSEATSGFWCGANGVGGTPDDANR